MRINVIIVLYFFVSCQNDAQQVACGESKQGFKKFELQGRNEVLDTSVRKIKTFKKWVFKVNNSDVESIGYKIYTDDESIGVKSICVDSDYVYITDVYHTNIKRINIFTGEVLSSKPIANLPADESGVWLRDIGIFGNRIFAPIDDDTLYVFSIDLNLLQAIPINNGRKYINNVKQNVIEICLDINQLSDKSIEKTLFIVDENGETSKIKKQTSINEYTKQELDVQGKTYKIFLKNQKIYFENEYGIMELEVSVPKILTYDSYNLNFNSTTLVYFDSTPTEFTLYVYKY